MEKTNWFPADVRPVHAGVYEVLSLLHPFTFFLAEWDGRVWKFPQTTVVLEYQHREWRGLAEQPK